VKSLFPLLDLGAVIRYIERKSEAILRSGVYRRNRLLVILGFSEKSGAGQTLITALNHYGFLETASNGYYFSKAAKRVAKNSTDDRTYIELLEKALCRPQIFHELDKALASNPSVTLRSVLAKYNLDRKKIEQVESLYKKSRDFVNAQRQVVTDNSNQKSQYSDSTESITTPTKEDRVLIDFGEGRIIPVSKKLILDAYLADLDKIRQRLL